MKLPKVKDFVNSRWTVLIFFLFISLVIVRTWFTNGIIYAGAEVGLTEYNPDRWFEISRNIWWGSSAPGQLIPHFIVGVPLYYFFHILQILGLSAQNIQQFFFTTLFFLMGFGMYLLALDILDEGRKRYAFAAGLFYSFNVYTLVQVWHRFLYSVYLLTAILPLLILFWRKWVKRGNFIDLIIFLLINFLSVYMFGNLASIITVWTALFLISLSEVIFPWSGKFHLTKAGIRFLVGFVSWLLTNIWWIIPTFLLTPGLLGQQHSSEDNLGTLIVISTQTILPYLLQLVNPYYLFYQSELGQIYSNIIFKIIPWLIFSIIFIGLFVALRLKKYAKYSLIYLLSLLLAKGAASPFSYPYIFTFEHFYFLGVLRNPFEKMGILLPIFGSVLFAVGVKRIFEWSSSRFGQTTTRVIFVLVILLLVGYAWPMFGGRFFGTEKLSIKVIVPSSYTEANEWFIKQKTDQGVILHLPFSGKDVVTYNWDKGYHGVDQNEILFTYLPSLSRTVGIKRVDDTLSSLTYIFSPQYLEKKEMILKVLQNFNVKYILLHKDIKWEDKDTYGDKSDLLNPNLVENILNNLDFLKREQQFGDLLIYRLTDENYKPTIFMTNNTQIVYPGKTDIMQIVSKSSELDSITPVDSNEIDLQSKGQVIVFPDKRFEYFEASRSSMISEINNIFLNPTASLNIYQLLKIRNYFHSIGYLKSEEITKDLILSTEKILQFYQQALVRKIPPSPEQITNYEGLIKGIFKKNSDELSIWMNFRTNIADIFRLHIFILRDLNQTSTLEFVEESMTKMELLPLHRVLSPTNLLDTQIKRQVFKFRIPGKGDYQLVNATILEKEDIRVNNEKITSPQHLMFDEGVYEISYNNLNQDSKDDIVLRLNDSRESFEGWRGVSFTKKSPVNFSGKITIDKPTFIFFQQTYHPGWILTLTKAGKSIKVENHFIGNLYANAWWVSEKGDYNFNIEFSPQRNVKTGIILASISGVFLILLNFFPIWKIFAKK